MRRLIFVPLLICLALLAIASGIAYWVYNNYTYYSTDDAQVSGQTVSVSAPATGTLSSLTVQPGATVSVGEQIGIITLPASQSGQTGQSGKTTTGATPAPTTVDVVSPMNGTVLQVPAVQNQLVATGSPIASVTDLGALTVTAYVNENAISNVSAGQAVDVHIDAYSDTSFTGHVKMIVSSTAATFSLLPNEDPSSGNFTKVGQRIPVIISLDGTSGKAIYPGMSAEVTIHLH